MIVLSLFDGISCGRVALERAGIKVDKYYASEIDEGAIAISKARYPDTIHLGSVTDWKEWDIDLSKVDLLIGGSPCQGFSIAGKQLNFNDPRSKLFFEYVDILNAIRKKNPNIKFLLDNVKMKQEYQDIITNLSESWCKWFSKRMDKLLSKQFVTVSSDKALTMTARQYANWNGTFVFECLQNYIVPFDDTLKVLEEESKNGRIMYFNSGGQGDRVYLIYGKAVTLCGEGGGRGAKMGCYLFGSITPDRINKRQNGQRFNDGQKFYTLTAGDKHGVLIEGYIRKLTPIECERLQTLPDNYTYAMYKGKPISDARRYKALGNV